MKEFKRQKGRSSPVLNQKEQNGNQSVHTPDHEVREFPKEEPLNIPERFWLGGLEVEVVPENDLILRKGMVAESHYNEQEIVIDMLHARDAFTEQTFLHELVHWILFLMNEDTLRNNERFVDVFAHFLYQFHKSAVYAGQEKGTAAGMDPDSLDNMDALSLLHQLYQAFPGMENGETDVNGGDLVQWFNDRASAIRSILGLGPPPWERKS